MPKDLEKLADELKAIAHPGRLAVLREYWYRNTPASPNEISQSVPETLGMVSYHVRKLHQAKLLKKAYDQNRRGAVEHYYTLTDKGLEWAYKLLAQ